MLLRQALIAGGVLAVALIVTLLIEPGAMKRSGFARWVPVFAGAGLGIWVLIHVIERRVGRRVPELTAVLAGVALAACLLQNGHYMGKALGGERIRAWNFFHYYLGSKYFAEVGYFDLYRAVLLADQRWRGDGGRAPADEDGRVGHFGKIREVRDLSTYRVRPRQKITGGYEPTAFTVERWTELGRDSRLLAVHMKPKTWKQVFIDLGYNGTPVWTALGRGLTAAVPLDGASLWLLANSDVPLLLLTFLALGWAFGARAAFAGLLWLCTIQFNHARLAGGFLQYDWLASSVVSVALFARGRPAAGGVALSWAVMTRGFPLLFAVPVAARLAVQLARRAPPDTDRVRFAVGLGAGCLALFLVTLPAGGGLTAWGGWLEKISVHSRMHPVMDVQRIGAGRLALHQPRDGAFLAERRGKRDARLEASLPRRHAIQLLGLVLLAAALVRRGDAEGMVLMLFAVFLAVTVSRYYASVWILLFALGPAAARGRPAWPATVAGGLLLGMAAWFFAPADRCGEYFLANYVALFMFVAVCVGYLVGDLRAWRRKRLSP